MKDAIDLANQIKDKSLREKTIKILKDPSSSNSEIVYPAEKFDKIPAWVGTHHSRTGGELEHTVSMTKIALSLAEHFEKTYGANVNKDFLISGALLHDIAKVFLLKRNGNEWELTGSTLDHAAFSAAELYAREFPEEVVHIVAAHGGDQGASAANPRTLEATIVFYSDVIDAAADSAINGVPNPIQFIFKQSEEEK